MFRVGLGLGPGWLVLGACKGRVPIAGRGVQSELGGLGGGGESAGRPNM